MGVFDFIFRKKITPKELRERYGPLTSDNVTNEELLAGVERQWRRYNCRRFQHYEVLLKLHSPKKDYQNIINMECECAYCRKNEVSLLNIKCLQ